MTNPNNRYVTYDDRYSFPPLGATSRPGDIRRGHRAVREGLAHLVSDTESYFRVLQGAMEDYSQEERAGAHGRTVDAAMDQIWVMLGVLRGALSLFPKEISVRLEADQGI
jgi:hypothetical protein